MTEPEDLDEDLFADLYDGDDVPSKPVQQAPPPVEPEPEAPSTGPLPANLSYEPRQEPAQQQQFERPGDNDTSFSGQYEGGGQVEPAEGDSTPVAEQPSHGPGIKEDGKMFIGGLNWETTDQSLKDYFSQFGEVVECTVMRDGATGRSRGFGFLTFKDPKTVNIVMVKEHYLDGKIIDPKRAIPRDEQERTSKIFVGGVSQEATEQDFKEFFMQFGRVVDATLMMDKDTGRPRGFGFVTFDSEAAVEATLSQPLDILGKPIEVKRAQPRGNLRDDDDRAGRFRRGKDARDGPGAGAADIASQGQTQQGMQGMYGGMTPQMMAQYWQRMQQYFAMMQQQMAASMTQGRNVPNPMAMGQMNPAMMQQMQAMQNMQNMQNMNRGQGMSGSPSPHPQSPGPQAAMQGMPAAMQGMPAAMQGMNPAMMQQMQQMQQMQGQPGGQQGNFGGGVGGFAGSPPNGGSAASGPMGNFSGGHNAPGYNAQEQLAFEQQKYEQQQARRVAREQPPSYPYQPGGPTSWEGMYDEVPQPNMNAPTGPAGRGGMQQGGFGRQMSPGQAGRGGPPNRASQVPTGPQSAPPANAPTGPKNAGKPGANYRGGGRGGHKGFHPYAR